jgi:hypothetical protein
LRKQIVGNISQIGMSYNQSMDERLVASVVVASFKARPSQSRHFKLFQQYIYG